MSTLFEVAAEYREVAAMLEDSGLDEQTIADTLESMQGEFESKAIAVASFARNLEAEAAAIDDAIKGMEARAMSLKKRSESLRDYLHGAMNATGIKKVSCPYFVIAIKANPSRVVIDDEAILPQQFMVTPPAPAPRPDKRAIAEALKFGPVVGAHSEKSTRIEIK